MKYKSGVIKSDLKRIFSSPRIYIALCISLFILLRPLSGAFTQRINATFLQIFIAPFATSDFAPFAAIFCVLPFADSFCEDYNSGCVRSIVIRTGVKKYSRQRCFTVMLSGGILMAVTVGLVIMICVLLANQPDTEETAQFLRHSIWAQMGILAEHQEILIALKILLGFLFGGLWALVGLMVSVFITNRYVTLIAPFVLYQMLWLMLEGSAFNPVYLLRGDSDFLPSLSFVLAWQMFLIVLCSIVSCLGIRKKVEA